MTELNQDFDALVKQINAKIKESAKALKEAAKLAKKAGYENGIINSSWAREAEEMPSDEDYDNEEDYNEAYDKASDAIEAKFALIDVSSLESAMEDAGWQPSSSYC